MDWKALIDRNPAPEPWSEGEKIPWNDPDFSQRMLKEHLSQSHDLASRRFEKIDQHVRWIHEYLLLAKPSRVLDLGCGPGLYTNRLAELGHTTTGIDFSPASIEYARKEAEADGLNCQYHLADIRTAEYGRGYDLVMLLFGEFNTFRPKEGRSIIRKASHSLAPGGILLLEVSNSEAIYELGHMPPTWYTSPNGLFSDRPHICLMEKFYDDETAVTTERYLIIDIETTKVSQYSSSQKAYTRADLQEMLKEWGFMKLDYFDCFGKDHISEDHKLFLVSGVNVPTTK